MTLSKTRLVVLGLMCATAFTAVDVGAGVAIADQPHMQNALHDLGLLLAAQLQIAEPDKGGHRDTSCRPGQPSHQRGKPRHPVPAEQLRSAHSDGTCLVYRFFQRELRSCVDCTGWDPGCEIAVVDLRPCRGTTSPWDADERCRTPSPAYKAAWQASTCQAGDRCGGFAHTASSWMKCPRVNAGSGFSAMTRSPISEPQSWSKAVTGSRADPML